jgi:hypothetical protein
VLGHVDEGELHFDFLHPKKRVSVTKQRLRKAPIAAAIAVVFVAAGAMALAAVTKDDRYALAALEGGIAKMEGEKRANERFLKLVEQIDGFDADQHVWVDVLYDIFAQLPSHQEMVVNHLEMNQKDARVTLKTQSRNRDTATEVRRKLTELRREGRDKPRFRVHVGSQTEKKNEKYSYAQDFRITVLDDESPKKGKSKRSSGG